MLSYDVDALLLDMDGTLIDSTAVADWAWGEIARRMVLDPADVVGHYHGVPGRRILRILDPEMSDARVEQLQAEATELEMSDLDGIVPIPGAAELLASLPADRWAIVTSCPRPLALLRLAAAGLPVPERMITADDVSRGKPDPEPYAAGAALLGVPPRRCLAVEDASAGLESARAAGCQVLGLLTTHDTLPAPSVADLSRTHVELIGSSLQVTAA